MLLGRNIALFPCYIEVQICVKCVCGRWVATGMGCTSYQMYGLSAPKSSFLAGSVGMEVGMGFVNVSSLPASIMLRLITRKPWRDMEEEEVSSSWSQYVSVARLLKKVHFLQHNRLLFELLAPVSVLWHRLVVVAASSPAVSPCSATRKAPLHEQSSWHPLR